MKRVQIDGVRIQDIAFVIEVPDDATEEQIEEIVDSKYSNEFFNNNNVVSEDYDIYEIEYDI